MYEDETIAFWENFPAADLAARCASLHAQRREMSQQTGFIEVQATRRAIAFGAIEGTGIEVGAGSRPFPIPSNVTCYYGDIRDKGELEKYFSTSDISLSGRIDAQSMDSVEKDSLDFVISAHVIEHLFDPIGAIENTISRLRQGGTFLLVVPEMTATFDRRRPPTSLPHLLTDWQDVGENSKLQAYEEHCRYVHPELTGETLSETEVRTTAEAAMARGEDIHVHAWRKQDFDEMLDHVSGIIGFSHHFSMSVQNENIYVLRRS